MTTSDSNQWLTSTEVSKMFNISSNVLLRWTREGKLPCIRINKRVIRFRKEAIAAWIKDNEQQG
jgi:excisionase family DNA binding protein